MPNQGRIIRTRINQHMGVFWPNQYVVSANKSRILKEVA